MTTEGGDKRTGNAKRFLSQEEWANGTAMWACMHGAWHSSHRAELSALVMAMHAEIPITVAIDNKAVVDKARQLIEIARQLAS